MQLHERAAQIWPMLVLAAHNRQTVTYTMVAFATGMHTPGIGKCLEPIQSYCLLNKLPALTSLVVDNTGKPGLGFIAAEDVPGAQAEVFNYDWLDGKLRAPTPEELAEAIVKLPSNGKQTLLNNIAE